MKRNLIITCLAVLVIVSVISADLYLSYAFVWPKTKKINKKLEEKFSKLIYIPKNVTRPQYRFDETSYFWDMVTNQNEVSGINFKFNPAFSSRQEEFTVSLIMPEGNDPSVFLKVLPAVIADKQSLDYALSSENKELDTSSNLNYSDIQITSTQNSNQTTKIIWNFDKQDLDEETQNLYKSLNLVPDFLLKFLFKQAKITRDLIGIK